MQYTCPHCGKDSEINPAALLGATTSKRKARAAKRNAKLGGWPKGRKRGKRKPTDPNVIAHGVVAQAAALTQQASVRRFPAG
jgi:hypothetical protein